MNDLTVVEKPAQWDRLKQMVLDSVSSPITKRVYNMALEEFLAWFHEAPRPGFTKATVSAWRASLEARGLGSSSIIIRMSAIRKLAALPAATLSLTDRGRLKEGFFADIVVFDPAKVLDHATYQRPQQLATGVGDVWVNGVRALRHEVATAAASGRAIRGRAWTGGGGSGCRNSAAD